MNRQLECLVLAYDAMVEARGEDAKRAIDNYDSLVDEFLLLHPTLSGETLGRLVVRAHRNWISAQRKTSSIPPKA